MREVAAIGTSWAEGRDGAVGQPQVRHPLAGRGWDLYLLAAIALIPLVVPPGPGQTAFVDLLNGVALAAFAAVVAARRVPIELPFLVPVMLIAAGSLLALTNAASVPAAMVTLLQDAYLYMWFVLLVSLLRARGDSVAPRVAWVVIADLVAIACVVTWLGGGGPVPADLVSRGGPRAAAAFYGPNMCADYLVLSVFVALGLRGHVKGPWLNPSLVLLLLGLIATKSNGGLISLAAGAVAWAAAGGVRGAMTRLRLAGMLALALAAGLFTWRAGAELGMDDRLIRVVGEESYLGRVGHSGESRSAIWRRLETSWAHAPLGIGPGNSPRQRLEIGQQERHGSFEAKEPHNDYIGYAVERGPLALAGLALALVQVFTVVLRGLRRAGNGRMAAAGAGLRAALLGGLIATTLHSTVIEKLHFRHYWAFLALVWVESLPATARPPRIEGDRVAPNRPAWAGGLAPAHAGRTAS